ncbi:hypothetical protein HDU86_005551 [Geranomyces michiganensis]|nr:hypothetical protein HDU86_005551 [Geranomyces michiganensis]
MHLSQQQKDSFDRDGYLVIRDFFSAEDAGRLREAAAKLVDNFDLDTHPKTKFSTGEEHDEHVGDKYFLDSGDKIHAFFEEKALDANGNLLVPRTRAINKIGHALHVLDPVFREFSTRQSVRDVVSSLGVFTDPRILQSMVIFKQPEIGGRVGPHQDSTFLYTRPLSAMGLWFALEDCTPENGCMYFLPGSHKTVPVTKRFVRKPDGTGTMFVPLLDGGKGGADAEVADPPEEDYVCEPTPVGTVVLIHGSVLHRSSQNLSPKSRWIYTFHCIEGSAEYPKDNWLQNPEGKPFTALL